MANPANLSLALITLIDQTQSINNLDHRQVPPNGIIYDPNPVFVYIND